MTVASPASGEDVEARGIGAVIAASIHCPIPVDAAKLGAFAGAREGAFPGFGKKVSDAMNEAAARIEAAPPAWRAAHCAEMRAIIERNGYGR